MMFLETEAARSMTAALGSGVLVGFSESWQPDQLMLALTLAVLSDDRYSHRLPHSQKARSFGQLPSRLCVPRLQVEISHDVQIRI